jgi:hypothetical protein
VNCGIDTGNRAIEHRIVLGQCESPVGCS